ncbi:MAG: bifunctional oligoribonuclease/PAP phosphatase NrnA [Erysipelotrichaceae bacterium]|nr:bifunctional oligoribonuclease/PAP phosphatase NrnA [Erysipelotrichaceae bacterium]
MIDQILDLLTTYPVITIFRHENADGDAFGAQCGLASWLKESFPTKEIYCLGKNGTDNIQLFNPMDIVSDEVVKKSLAVILDTANQQRIDDQRYRMAAMTIKIDHHPEVEVFGNLRYVDTKRASSCEMVGELISRFQPLSTISAVTASYLYMGILTDTLRFSTANTSSDTLRIASQLAGTGINIAALNSAMFSQDQNYFKLASVIRQRAVFQADNRIVYVYLTQEQLASAHVSYEKAKDLINEFNALAQLEVWILFIEDETNRNGLFNVSIRSRNISVNDVAAQFKGGGHRLAAGAKLLTENDTHKLIDIITYRLNQNK